MEGEGFKIDMIFNPRYYLTEGGDKWQQHALHVTVKDL